MLVFGPKTFWQGKIWAAKLLSQSVCWPTNYVGRINLPWAVNNLYPELFDLKIFFGPKMILDQIFQG